MYIKCCKPDQPDQVKLPERLSENKFLFFQYVNNEIVIFAHLTYRNESNKASSSSFSYLHSGEVDLILLTSR